jgi:hypothetical protein
MVGRIETSKKSRVTNAPVAAGGMVFVQNDAGQIFAFRSHSRS